MANGEYFKHFFIHLAECWDSIRSCKHRRLYGGEVAQTAHQKSRGVLTNFSDIADIQMQYINFIAGGELRHNVMWHSRWTYRVGWSSCSMTNSLVTNAILIERAVTLHLYQLISHTTQCLDSWLSNYVLQSELKIKINKIVESRGGTCPSSL